MERNLERRRETEPVLHDYNWNETAYLRWLDEKRRASAQPHVIRFDKVPWAQVQQAYHKVLVGSNKLEDRLVNGPIYTMICLEQIISPGRQSGRHRHFMEALFYIIEGSGWEIHDDVKYPWEAGDIMSVPTYCVHQHFADPTSGARLFYVGSNLFSFMGLGHVEQMELHQSFVMPDGASPIHSHDGQIVGYRKIDGTEISLIMEDSEKRETVNTNQSVAPLTINSRDTYEDYVSALPEQSRWRKTCPHVVKPAQRHWERTRMGKLKYLVNAKLPSGSRIFDAWLQELPPGGHSGKHRHVAEEVHLVLDGNGYDVHDNQRWDWGKDDVVCIPINSVHQHFNADSKRPALFLSVQPRIYEFIGHKGIEHLEDAS